MMNQIQAKKPLQSTFSGAPTGLNGPDITQTLASTEKAMKEAKKEDKRPERIKWERRASSCCACGC